MKEESNDYVVVHPLIVEKNEVVIMPEVTRVLRIVFQVLSQPNYYLSKSGISSRRLSGPHLMKLKILGIVNNDVKVCSYISKEEALDIFQSFSSLNAEQYLNKIVWSKTIDIENETVDFVKSQVIKQSLHPELTYFIHEGKSIVPWMGFLKILSCDNIDSEKLTDEFVESLQSSIIFKEIEDHAICNYLSKIQKLQHFGPDLKYVSMEEIMDILIKLGISVTSLPVINELNKIRLLPPIYLDKGINGDIDEKSLLSTERSVPKDMGPLPPDVLAAAGLNVPRLTLNKIISTSESNSSRTKSSTKSDLKQRKPSSKSPGSHTVFVYEVNGTLVVALPDIHKIIRRAQNLLNCNSGAKSAQQRQVNYYLTKMRCKKGRFTFMQLKTIRRIGTPLGNATYCTFINKEDAINLFKIYASLNMENPEVFQSINFSDPISLGIENIMDITSSGGYGSCNDAAPYDTSVEYEQESHFVQRKKEVTEEDPISYQDNAPATDRELFRKYEIAKAKLKRMESHMAIIVKYYKWKMSHINKTNRYLKAKWKCISGLLDSIDEEEFTDDNEEGIISQNGNLPN